MAIVTHRRRPRSLGILTAAMASLALSAPAQAAPRSDSHAARPNGSTRAGLASATPSAQAKAGALSQMTHLKASQVTAAAVCPAADRGQVRCAAQDLLIRSSHHPVRPLVSRRASLTQVFPRVARGVAPAAGSASQTPPGAGTPAYLQQAYDLSYLSQTAGSSDTVAVVDAYDDPHAESDLATYRSNFGLPPCTTANGCFHKLNGSGNASPLPAGSSGWEMEESLDLDAVSALCPNCHLMLVEATTSSFSDMDQAEITAAAQGAKQISNSWAGGSSGVLGGTYTFPGVSVIAATGDSVYDGPGWDAYPAALPGVTAAGGTTLAASTSGAPSLRYSGSAGPVAAAALTALSPPTITGIARPGQTLTSTAGTWNSSGTYSYQWQYAATATSGWSNITGATSATYTLPGADVHAIVRLNVTLTNNSSRGTAYSGAIGPVTTSATTVSRGAIFALASLDRWLRG